MRRPITFVIQTHTTEQCFYDWKILFSFMSPKAACCPSKLNVVNLACVLKILKNVVGLLCRVASIRCKINVLAFESYVNIYHFQIISISMLFLHCGVIDYAFWLLIYHPHLPSSRYV